MRICTIITINEQRSGNLRWKTTRMEMGSGDVWACEMGMSGGKGNGHRTMHMTARVMCSDGIRRGLRVSFV